MKTIEDIVVIKALDIIEWCYGRGENLQDSEFVKHTLMGIAQQQKDVDEDAMHAIVEEQVNKAIEKQKAIDKEYYKELIDMLIDELQTSRVYHLGITGLDSDAEIARKEQEGNTALIRGIDRTIKYVRKAMEE